MASYSKTSCEFFLRLFFFFQSDQPTQYQETYSTLYEKKGDGLTLSQQALVIFKIYIMETKLDFVSFCFFKDDGNLFSNVTFPYKTLILVRFNVCVTAGTRNL